MPREIVKLYRKVYEKQFMMQTLLVVPKALIKTQAFDGDLGFRERYILVNFAGCPHGKIEAVNYQQQDPPHGYIYVNSDLHNRPKDEQIVVLAEEWIESMMGFREPGKIQKSIRGKIHLALMFNSLKRRGFWQDNLDEHEALHSALRSLLVPKDRLEQMCVELHEKTLTDLKQQIEVSPQEAQISVEKLVLTFAAKYYVNKEIVWDRLMAVMLNGDTE